MEINGNIIHFVIEIEDRISWFSNFTKELLTLYNL